MKNSQVQLPKVCVVKDTPLTYSETFIRHHAACLGTEPYVFLSFGYKQGLVPAVLRVVNRVSLALAGKSLLMRFSEMRFRKHLKDSGTEAVLAEFGPTGVSVKNICASLGIPLVTHFHGYDASRSDVLRRNKKKYKALFEASTAIVAVSREMAETLKGLGADKDKIFLNSCGVDTEKFKPADPSSNPPVFLAVGRLVEKKSPDSTIMAFARIVDDFPDARLIVVGSGPLHGLCKRIVSDFKLEAKVELRPSCSHEEVVGLMSQARCFVQHSKVAANGDREGTPVAVLEAGSSCLPVISTRHAGIKDAVVDEVTGILVDEDDIQAMAAAMRKVAADPCLARRMGLAGRRHVIAHYSHEVVDARLREIMMLAFKKNTYESKTR
ncbi:MAG TPA: glycosyltransferase [Candidatus Paceibacterota bacterium]